MLPSLLFIFFELSHNWDHHHWSPTNQASGAMSRHRQSLPDHWQPPPSPLASPNKIPGFDSLFLELQAAIFSATIVVGLSLQLLMLVSCLTDV
ncbi:hypothetical protein NL676_028365 [Syzygium grande]|nr:hypothetical protein NL676_028365 [Syzygium grande]